MWRRAAYKMVDELAAHDLNQGCRWIIRQDTRGMRTLKKVLRRQARSRINEYFRRYENGKA